MKYICIMVNLLEFIGIIFLRVLVFVFLFWLRNGVGLRIVLEFNIVVIGFFFNIFFYVLKMVLFGELMGDWMLKI